MAQPVLVQGPTKTGIASGSPYAASTLIPINLPGSLVTGNTLWAIVVTDKAQAPTWSGWTNRGYENLTTNIDVTVFTKLVTGSEGATDAGFTIPVEEDVHVYVYEVSGGDTANAEILYEANDNNIAISWGTTHSPTSSEDHLVLAAVGVDTPFGADPLDLTTTTMDAEIFEEGASNNISIGAGWLGIDAGGDVTLADGALDVGEQWAVLIISIPAAAPAGDNLTIASVNGGSSFPLNATGISVVDNGATTDLVGITAGTTAKLRSADTDQADLVLTVSNIVAAVPGTSAGSCDIAFNALIPWLVGIPTIHAMELELTNNAADTATYDITSLIQLLADMVPQVGTGALDNINVVAGPLNALGFVDGDDVIGQKLSGGNLADGNGNAPAADPINDLFTYETGDTPVGYKFARYSSAGAFSNGGDADNSYIIWIYDSGDGDLDATAGTVADGTGADTLDMGLDVEVPLGNVEYMVTTNVGVPSVAQFDADQDSTGAAAHTTAAVAITGLTGAGTFQFADELDISDWPGGTNYVYARQIIGTDAGAIFAVGSKVLALGGNFPPASRPYCKLVTDARLAAVQAECLAGTPAWTRLKSYAETIEAASGQFSWKADLAKFCYLIDGAGLVASETPYRDLAIANAEAYVASEEALAAAYALDPIAANVPNMAFDSFLYIGSRVSEIMLTLDACWDDISAGDRTRWANICGQALNNLHNNTTGTWDGVAYTWSGWVINSGNSPNNYWHSFAQATAIFGIVAEGLHADAALYRTTYQTMIDNIYVPDHVTDWNGGGGGGLEGNVYGQNYHRMFEQFLIDEASLEADNRNSHAAGFIDWLLHQSVANGGDQISLDYGSARSFTTTERGMLLSLGHLYPARAAEIKGVLDYLLPQSDSSRGYLNDVLYNLDTVSPADLPSTMPLYHYEEETGDAFWRNAWFNSENATVVLRAWQNGPHQESHSHKGQPFQINKAGHWLLGDANHQYSGDTLGEGGGYEKPMAAAVSCVVPLSASTGRPYVEAYHPSFTDEYSTYAHSDVAASGNVPAYRWQKADWTTRYNAGNSKLNGSTITANAGVFTEFRREIVTIQPGIDIVFDVCRTVAGVRKDNGWMTLYPYTTGGDTATITTPTATLDIIAVHGGEGWNEQANDLLFNEYSGNFSDRIGSGTLGARLSQFDDSDEAFFVTVLGVDGAVATAIAVPGLPGGQYGVDVTDDTGKTTRAIFHSNGTPVTMQDAGATDAAGPVYSVSPNVTGVSTTTIDLTATAADAVQAQVTHRSVVVLASDPDPSDAEVAVGHASGGGAPLHDSGDIVALNNVAAPRQATGLTQNTAYAVHSIVKDSLGNLTRGSTVTQTTSNVVALIRIPLRSRATGNPIAQGVQYQVSLYDSVSSAPVSTNAEGKLEISAGSRSVGSKLFVVGRDEGATDLEDVGFQGDVTVVDGSTSNDSV